MKQTILILIIVFSGKLLAYPTNPFSLKELIETSDLIVYGAVDDPKEWNKVISKEFSEKDGKTLITVIPGWSNDGIAEIIPLKIYKGPKDYSRIHIKSFLGVTCPSPAFYKDKGYAISFLRRTDDSLWITNGLRYGSKNMETTDEFFFYDSLISSYLEILSINTGKKRRKAIQEWLVKCCENENTIWDGAIEFNTEGPYDAYYRDYQKTKYDKKLNDNQIKRLEYSFFKSDSISRGVMMLSNTLLKYTNKEDIRDFLIMKFEYTNPIDIKDLIVLINALSDSKEMNKLCEEIVKDYYYWGADMKNINVQEFLRIAKETYPNKT